MVKHHGFLHRGDSCENLLQAQDQECSQRMIPWQTAVWQKNRKKKKIPVSYENRLLFNKNRAYPTEIEKGVSPYFRR